MKRKQTFFVLLFASLLLILDIGLKRWVFTCVSPFGLPSFAHAYGEIPIFTDVLGIDFSITHVINRGGAWGLFSQYSYFLLAFRLIAISAMLVFLYKSRPLLLKHVPLLLVVTGALANVCDAFIYGYVIDMFHFNFWGYSYPVFNIADSIIFIGIFTLIVQSIRAKKKRPKTEPIKE